MTADSTKRLRRTIYVSRVVDEIASIDLRHIVGLAQVLHRRRDLSGVLAYTGHHFYQVIEGAPRDVDHLLALIRADRRHDQIRVLSDEPVQRRQFDRWYSLHLETPELIDRVAAAHSEQSAGDDLVQRLVLQLKADDLMG